MPRPLNLPFDPIARAGELWAQRWGPSEAMKAVTAVMRAQQILLAELDGILKTYDLTFARYEALVLLEFSAKGELPLSKIGERLMVHPTSVTNTVDRLARQGFVTRRRNPRDGRGVLAAITERGRGVVDRATADLMAVDFGLGSLAQEELAELFALLRRLRIEAGDFEAGDPGAG
ncbi:MAG: MarR family winged helix-turn-helix transcriptional regulator [Streptomycetales bacterium]